jgi:hypothetical protein
VDKVDQRRQVVELLEMILVEIRKELSCAGRVRADLEIVNVRVPVPSHGF